MEGIENEPQAESVEGKTVDREKMCPMLVRLFTCLERHNAMRDYGRTRVPSNELQIHTWKDCTLRELTRLVKKAIPESRRRGTTCSFAIISPDDRAMVFRSREIGSTIIGQPGSMDDDKTLADARFVVGDYIDAPAFLKAHMRLKILSGHTTTSTFPDLLMRSIRWNFADVWQEMGLFLTARIRNVMQTCPWPCVFLHA
uniref:18 kDa Sin3-associated polypeptide n=1 Tax=Trichuris muris TaxID=70415 RepID=A0A5S6QHL6_TRIMR